MAYRTMNPSRGTESRRLGSAISVMARAAFARRHIACAKDQRSVCFQLAGRRGVTVFGVRRWLRSKKQERTKSERKLILRTNIERSGLPQ